MRRTAVLLALVAGLVACGDGGERPALSGAPTTTTTAPADTFPPIPVGLPGRGIASSTTSGVELWSMDGELLASLPGLTLSSDMVPGGPILLYRYDEPSTYSPTYRIDREAAAYVEDAAAGADVAQAIPAPSPGALGHWRWTVDRPDGTVLAQWSGECEVPAAFFVGADGAARHVLGTVPWWEAPNTFGMGWLDDGRALVDVAGDAPCGTASPEPGRYAIDPVTLEREPMALPAGVMWHA